MIHTKPVTNGDTKEDWQEAGLDSPLTNKSSIYKLVQTHAHSDFH